MRIRHLLPALLLLGLLVFVGKALTQATPTQLPVAQAPLFTKTALPPLNMLVMGKDHKIYFSAYNDTSDLDGDGILDVGYRGWVLKEDRVEGESPFKIDYYGYFNSYVCYAWSGTTGESASGQFVPQSYTSDKTCGGTSWSGDFLNYLTTSRMDALRKVLYGGYRAVDDADKTVLEGSFFPQDGHSWGKEYQSIDRDGYDIRKYAPLGLPSSGKYHLFAVTTTQDFASSGYNGPLFRVLQNTPTRVYNWLSIEAPVAGNKCFNSSNQRVDCTSTGTAQPYPGHPADRAGFDTMEANYAKPAYQFGNGTISNINCNSNNSGDDCNPYGANDNFLAIMQGTFQTVDFTKNNTVESGTYEFAVDGDDAVDMQLLNGNNVVASTGYYGGHGVCNCTTRTTGSVSLNSNTSYTLRFRMEEQAGGEAFILRYRARAKNGNWSAWATVPAYNNSGSSGRVSGFDGGISLATYNLTPVTDPVTRQDYRVRVQVCTSNAAVRDDTCKAYPNGNYKPTGILHDYGEENRMYFGLITGSQPNNIEGGVLRRNIGSFSDEINPTTGQFNSVVGIAKTISSLRMIGGAYGGSVTNNYNSDTAFNWGNGKGNCGGSANPISNGNCRMWGNPIAEMLYESMRYFAGASTPTPRFANSPASSNGAAEEVAMGLPSPSWVDPYRKNGGYPFCAKPYQTIISDINPSYDGDLPGSAFNANATTGDTPSTLKAFSATAEGQEIWNQQFGGSRNVFIGDVGGVTDGAPTPKLATSFGNIRGLSPEEPTKNGTYYSASVARYGHVNDVSAAAGDQKINTYAIALASPLPKFQFGNITILPFGKTVSGTFGGDTRKPTNTIVALYIEQIENLNGTTKDDVNGGRPYASFRISYEDVEQGNDFDMDAIVRYVVTQNADKTVTVNLTSEYAAGSANQNLGYVISGTTKDGVYLEVRDSDSAQNTSVYALNTPAGVDAGGCATPGATGTAPCNAGLTLNASRTFTPSATSTAVQLQDPLWYAAKFGGFADTGKNGVITSAAQWDADGNGTPDNYFLVTNPLYLRPQLEKAFDTIQADSANSGSLAIAGAQVSSNSFAVLPSYASPNGVDWIGDLKAFRLTSAGLLGTQLWSAAALLPSTSAGVDARKIYTALAPVASANRGTVVKEFRATNLGSSRAEVLAQLGYPTEGEFNVDFGSGMSADSIVKYLRGDKTAQGTTLNSAPYRTRSSIMGDIVNSAPVVSSKRSDFGWSSAGGLSAAQRTAYTSYVNGKASKREYAFVGANDGMLHAFNDAGVESFAYVPNSLLGRTRLTGLGYLANRSYSHRYYVDGKLTVADALMAATGNWGTVLVGGLGAGQKGAFGLNVTNPDSFGANDVLWEVNDKSSTPAVAADIGLVMGQPVVVPLDNGKWVALFGNGYNSTNGDPVLFVVDVESGAVLARVKPNWKVSDLLNTNAMNGLGNIAVADTNGDGLVDSVYGGDLQGNVWKFDLSGATAASWNVAYSGNALFTAKDPSGNRQPITGGFELSVGPNGGYMVYFGTGRYFATGDNNTTDLQTVYGIWDNGSSTVTGRGVLAQQQILLDDNTTPPTRSVSSNAVNYLAQRGWYMDLAVKDNNGKYMLTGERMIGNPRIQSGKIYFPTYIPSVGSDCVPGGTNWLYGLNPLSGAAALGQVAVAPDNTPVGSGSTGGVSSGSGAPSQGVGVTQPSPTLPTYCNPADPDCVPDSPTGTCSEVVVDPINPTQSLTIQRVCGRQSWRQLR